MMCQKCGRTNPEGAQFCNGCGGVLPALTLVTDMHSQVARSGEERHLSPTGQDSPVSAGSSPPSGAIPHITIINQQGGGSGGLVNPVLLTDAADKNPALAAFLGLLIPGLGQFYNGEIGKGVLMFIACAVLWAAFAGWVINIWSTFDAYRVATRKRLQWQLLLAGQGSQGQVARLGN